jgi:hypothetical protein
MPRPSPRFRKDLAAAATEQDGVPCVTVTDPRTGTSFTLYEFEYDLAHQLNGQPVDDIVAWAAADYQTALTAEAIGEFAAKLGEMGFIEEEDAPAARPRGESAVEDSAEVEWNAAVPTSQFVPDASMLAGSPADQTPAVPSSELARMFGDAEPTATGVAADSAPTMTGFEAAVSKAPAAPELAEIDELPVDALTELPDSGPVTSSGSSSSGVPKPMAATPSGGTNAFASGSFSKGVVERRQPPGPEAVVMTPFEDVSRRFRAPPPERQRNSTGLVVGILVLLVGGGGGGYYAWMRLHPKAPDALRMRVVAPRPTAVYRWFATAGTVVDLESRTMTFDWGGKVVEILPAGTKFVAGDTLGKLQGAAALEVELAKHKAKLASFEQLRDSIKDSGNKANLRDAQDKVTARKKLFDDTQAALAKLVLRATESGSIVETPVKVGTVVASKAPALKWRGRSLHGDFTMDQEDFARALKLDFCRVEVAGFATPGAAPGAQAPSPSPSPSSSTSLDAAAAGNELRYVDCTLPPPLAPSPGIPSPLRKFIVTLPTDAGLVTGQQLHLARKRFDAVFPLPLSAVAVQTDTEAKVWIAAPNGKAEQRTVTVAEARDEVLVSQGLNVGDEVIAEPPSDLVPGTPVEPIR